MTLAEETLEATKTRKSNGITWYANAEDESWWNADMTACITKHHSSKWVLCDGNMIRQGTYSSMRDAMEAVA
jgi:hypothetical protein